MSVFAIVYECIANFLCVIFQLEDLYKKVHSNIREDPEHKQAPKKDVKVKRWVQLTNTLLAKSCPRCKDLVAFIQI